MKKLILFLVIFLSLNLSSQAAKLQKEFDGIIKSSGISKSSISVSIKDTSSGKTVYSVNDKMLMHPASVQKILTIPPVMEVLGDDYEFRTELYTRGEDSYLIKLGADPYLASSDIKEIVKHLDKATVKKIYIDDSILEKKDWGEGWQWDDDLNTSMPRFNSYNLDKNIIKITVMPTKIGEKAEIINPSKYPLVFFNNVITGTSNNVKVSRDSSISSNTLTLDGTISKPEVIYIPSNNLKRYFYTKLTNALADRNIYLKSSFTQSLKNENDKLIYTVNHPVSIGVNDILKNSSNLTAEVMAKIAGGKAYNDVGSDILGIKLFNSYCKKLGIDNSRIRLTDASGVSKNNLVDTDFITEYLVKNENNLTLKNMARPSEGTLSARMIPLGNNLRAKTGTLSDISSIAGFITAKSGKNYAFCIIINDTISNSSEKKVLEDYIIREMYLRL